MSKAQRTVEFGSSVGLHARPASALAKAAGESGHTITLTTPAGKTPVWPLRCSSTDSNSNIS